MTHSVEKPEGPYPTYVEQDGGRVVPVVQVSKVFKMKKYKTNMYCF